MLKNKQQRELKPNFVFLFSYMLSIVFLSDIKFDEGYNGNAFYEKNNQKRVCILLFSRCEGLYYIVLIW